MTSSSSLYGAVNQQNTQSTNSTSLYGGADTPIPTPAGDLVVRGDLIVLSGNILTTATTGNIFPANATTVNLALAATAVNIGADTGTTTINNNLVVDGSVTAEGADFGLITIAVADDQTITTTSGELRVSSATGIVKLPSVTSIYTDNTGTFNLLNQPTVVNAFGAATTLNIGANGGETNINNDLLVEGIGTFTGDITAPGADLGNITVGIADNNTIATTTGGLKLTPTDSNIGLIGVDTLYTDTTGTFNLLNQPTTIYAFDEATTLEIGATSGVGTTVVRNSFAVDGTQVGLAQATNILYSENNDRLNRPAVRSTTGNTSGWRVEAPNATTSAVANISAFSSNDNDNGKFISIQARGATSNDLRIQTGKYTAGVLSGSGTVVSFIDNITAYATVNPNGPTDPLDLTTKAYVDALPANVTYTIDSTAVTGGANLNLVGSDATTDSVKFAGGTNVTVTRTDANTITISAPDTNTTYTQNASATTGGANRNLVGSDATTDTIKFAEGAGISVSRTDANTITITNTVPDVNTTYTQNFSSTTGGTNLNLVGSDSTTDTVKFADGVGVTVSYTDASTATIAIGQAVGTTDNVQFNGVTTNSITTGTVNANGGVSFVNTAPMGGTYATVNQFGPFNGTDLTTVDYVNSVLPTVVTYTQDASATTGGANLNLVGSNSTTDTVKFAEGLGIDVVQTDANTITTSLNATLDDLSNVDNTTTALASGQMFYYNGTNWVNSDQVDSPNISRFSRTNSGTANNAIVAISRNRGDAARAVDGGPWLGFEYVGTDNTQATAPQNAIRSRYQTSGNHQMQFLQLAGSYNAVTVMGQIQRGSTFFNTTGGVANLLLTDTTARVGGTTTTITNSANTQTYASFGSTLGSINQDTFTIKNNAGTTTYAQFLSTGATISAAGLSTITRTTVGTPGSPESRPSMNIQLIRSDQATPNDGDGTSFRTRVGGSNGTFYTLSDINSTYDTAGDVSYNINLANGDQTGATFSSLPVYSGSITNTIIRAGTASATPGASTVSSVAKFEATKITAFVPVKFPAYTAAAANAITGELGWQICISDSEQGSNPNGMMAFWDTTNSRWSYIHDNSAV